MREFRDEKGRLVAVTSNAPLNTTVDNQPMETPPADLAYLRPCPLRRFPAEVAVKHGDTYFVVAINRNQLMNMLEAGTTYLREFDKRPIEDTDIE
jgi:hypothetical protein